MSAGGSGNIKVGAAKRRREGSHLTHGVIGCVRGLDEKIDRILSGICGRAIGSRDIGECVVVNRILLSLAEFYGIW